MILDNSFYLYPKMTHHQLWSIRFFRNHHGDTFYHTRWKDKRIAEWFFSAISVSKASPGCCVCQQWSHSIWCSCHGDEAICGVSCLFSAVVNQLLSCPYSLTWYSIYYILYFFYSFDTAFVKINTCFRLRQSYSISGFELFDFGL